METARGSRYVFKGPIAADFMHAWGMGAIDRGGNLFVLTLSRELHSYAPRAPQGDDLALPKLHQAGPSDLHALQCIDRRGEAGRRGVRGCRSSRDYGGLLAEVGHGGAIDRAGDLFALTLSRELHAYAPQEENYELRKAAPGEPSGFHALRHVDRRRENGRPGVRGCCGRRRVEARPLPTLHRRFLAVPPDLQALEHAAARSLPRGARAVGGDGPIRGAAAPDRRRQWARVPGGHRRRGGSRRARALVERPNEGPAHARLLVCRRRAGPRRRRRAAYRRTRREEPPVVQDTRRADPRPARDRRRRRRVGGDREDPVSGALGSARHRRGSVPNIGPHRRPRLGTNAPPAPRSSPCWRRAPCRAA